MKLNYIENIFPIILKEKKFEIQTQKKIKFNKRKLKAKFYEGEIIEITVVEFILTFDVII